MRKMMALAAGVAMAAALAGCGGRRLGGKGPDEFTVARQPPLVIPPDYALVPPQPGAVRAGDTTPQQQTLDALFGGTANRSAAERGVVSQAGGESADPGIRSAVGDPKTNVVDKGATTRDIVAAPQGDGQDARAVAK